MIEGSLCIWTVRSVHKLLWFQECPRVALFILYTSELFHIVENPIVGYADMQYMLLFLRRFRVLTWKNCWIRICHFKHFWCLKWHPRITKSMEVSRSRTIAPGYGDISLGGAELEELKNLRILRVTWDPKLTFETRLWEVMSKVARSLGVVHRAGKLCDCLRELKSSFNTYVLYSLEYCAPECMSSAKFHLGLLGSILSAVRKGCMRVSFFVWGREGRLAPCVCSMRFITEWPTLWVNIWIIL